MSQSRELSAKQNQQQFFVQPEQQADHFYSGEAAQSYSGKATQYYDEPYDDGFYNDGAYQDNWEDPFSNDQSFFQGDY